MADLLLSDSRTGFSTRYTSLQRQAMAAHRIGLNDLDHRLSMGVSLESVFEYLEADLKICLTHELYPSTDPLIPPVPLNRTATLIYTLWKLHFVIEAKRLLLTSVPYEIIDVLAQA